MHDDRTTDGDRPGLRIIRKLFLNLIGRLPAKEILPTERVAAPPSTSPLKVRITLISFQRFPRRSGHLLRGVISRMAMPTRYPATSSALYAGLTIEFLDP